MTPNTLSHALAALLLSSLSPCLVAQTLTVDPGGVIPAGSTATVSYTDASRAGQTIVVTVVGGVPPTQQEIFITLDAKGKGSAPWTAPANWPSAYFTGPGGASLRVAIE